MRSPGRHAAENQYGLAFRGQVGGKPRGASRKGPNRLLARHYAERLAMHTELNPPNRRMRTRMYGGVGGCVKRRESVVLYER